LLAVSLDVDRLLLLLQEGRAQSRFFLLGGIDRLELALPVEQVAGDDQQEQCGQQRAELG